MSARWIAAPLLAAAAACAAPSTTDAGRAPAQLDLYDVVWTTPSRDASGSMPIGNGEVGLNVWTEPGGDLAFYVARTDAWSEACRLLKLGRVRLHFEPNSWPDGAPFEARLRLRDGRIEVRGGEGEALFELELAVDPDHDVVLVRGASARPIGVAVALECWRDQRKSLKGAELDSSWTMRGAPDSIEVAESADVVLDDPSAVVWYHRNDASIVPLTLAHQGLAEVAHLVRDPLIHRTFGGRIEAEGFAKNGPRELATRAPVERFEIRIAAISEQLDDAGAWPALARAEIVASRERDAFAAASAWWNAFWARSWVFVDGDPPPAEPASSDAAPASRVTQAYLLQRWIQACGGRGRYPIKFNGSIFTVDPRFTGGPDFDPDWRKWGGDYWWQNTRLPYHAMLASGDYEMLRPLFRMYADALPICEARARLYFGAEGAYFPETMTIFGTYSNGDYGWDRTGLDRNQVQCPWWANAWNQGPELVALMLDFFEHERDDEFARDELVPMARAVLRYFDTRFPRDAAGKLVIAPTQALETHWHGVVNDLPTVAGLTDVTARLTALPERLVDAADRELFERVRAAVPPLPTRVEDGVRLLAAAERFDPSRQNCETPELYAVFPFRLAPTGSACFEAAREAYRRRHDRIAHGWAQDGQFAALLGFAEDARENVLEKVGNANPGHRFPAMWGPNFDWLPDQDHGSNLMTTLQLMLLQEDAGGARPLAAWPLDWKVEFKLRGRGGRTWEVASGDAVR